MPPIEANNWNQLPAATLEEREQQARLTLDGIVAYQQMRDILPRRKRRIMHLNSPASHVTTNDGLAVTTTKFWLRRANKQETEPISLVVQTIDSGTTGCDYESGPTVMATIDALGCFVGGKAMELSLSQQVAAMEQVLETLPIIRGEAPVDVTVESA
ncbi:MAG: hypothetical protein JWN38_1036 [Candidatus Saccharibacteria bacterium]|nr:hypothetical protein [Candidatus Saccharibacteria bacterium]